jgi:hypothetical protein
MPDPRDAQQVLEALALTGATTVVAAMATSAWEAARSGTARLFHCRGHALSVIEAQLDGDAELVVQDPDTDGARGDLVGAWKRRLTALLREFPDAQADLTALIDQVRGDLPPAQQSWQINFAGDHGIVNAVQSGNQYTFYMDSPNPQDRPGPQAGEAET